MDRDGKVTPLRTLPADWSNLVFAPDRRRLALDIFDGSQTDVWIYEWERDSLDRLTLSPGGAQKPVWTPDGRRIVFTRGGTGTGNLYWQRADNTGELQRLTDSKSGQAAWSWHPNGRFLAFHEVNPQTQDDVLILPMEGDEASGWKPGTPIVFLNGPFAERAPMFSPDGRWLAYQSTDRAATKSTFAHFRVRGVDGRSRPTAAPRPLGPAQATSCFLPHQTADSWSRRTLWMVMYSARRSLGLWAEGNFVARPRTGPTRSFDLHPDGNASRSQRSLRGKARRNRTGFPSSSTSSTNCAGSRPQWHHKAIQSGSPPMCRVPDLLSSLRAQHERRQRAESCALA